MKVPSGNHFSRGQSECLEGNEGVQTDHGSSVPSYRIQRHPGNTGSLPLVPNHPGGLVSSTFIIHDFTHNR